MPGKCGVTALMGVDTPPMEGTWGGAGKEVVKAVFVRCTIAERRNIEAEKQFPNGNTVVTNDLEHLLWSEFCALRCTPLRGNEGRKHPP